MGRFAVVLPLEPLAAGDAFPVSAWPLHVTVVGSGDESASGARAPARRFMVLDAPDGINGAGRRGARLAGRVP